MDVQAKVRDIVVCIPDGPFRKTTTRKLSAVSKPGMPVYLFLMSNFSPLYDSEVPSNISGSFTAEALLAPLKCTN
jgi:hypothetical protein